MGRRRTVGYVENEWTCPNCGGRNKGSVQTCDNCGAPQPDDVKFELPSEQKLVKDEAKVKAAAAGADIHCGFCSTRNPGNAVTCSQCGGDLAEGQAREAGRIMQAPPPPPKVIKCENCETENPGSNSVCSNCGAALPKHQAAQPALAKTSSSVGQSAAKKKISPKLIGGILGFIALCCIGVYFLFGRTASTVEGTVTSVHWETSVPVQEVQSVDYSNERGSAPSDAYNVSCYDESRDVCEQKTIDQGNGYSEIVEECHTETEKYCSYTVDEWKTIQTYTLEGNDLRPIYESPNISSDQRLGDQSEEFTVTFSAADRTEVYSPDTLSTFQQFEIGSTWTLELNLMGGVVGVER